MLAHTYAHLFGLQVICLRFFTVYGPRQRPDLAIRKFTALIEAGKPLPIFGDGSTARDYTYVDDIVAGILASIDYKLKLPSGFAPFEVFNLGNSHPVKLTELIELLESVTGRKAICEWRPPQPGDSPMTWADTSKANCVLGYRPYTSLEFCGVVPELGTSVEAHIRRSRGTACEEYPARFRICVVSPCA